MPTVFFITHPDVLIDPETPVLDWHLNERGIERMHATPAQPWLGGVKAVACSSERKARDGATILAEYLGLTTVIHAGIGENDRSATGYLPKPEFEAVVDAFFARPEESVRGWERAVDAQARIVSAVRDVLTTAPEGGVAVVSHGGVGALLLCHLCWIPIARAANQPPGNGGYYYEFDRATWSLRHDWRPIDP